MNDINKSLIYIIAGEASGDLIGASLMAALRVENPQLKFSGIGGQNMMAQGLQSLFPMQELSIMGIFEIIPQIFKILKRIKQTRQHIAIQKPSVIITIDAPGFNFRVVKNLKNKGVTLFHYVAPSVWAWRPWRARKVAKLYDCLLTLFKFEPKYFIPYGLKTFFVGHPLIEKNITEIDPNLFFDNHHIDAKIPLLCLLPGSRQREIKTLTPIFIDSTLQLQKDYSNLQVVVPTLDHLIPQLQQYFDDAKLSVIFTTDEHSKYAAMRASSVALAASGTVTLELALAETPMVVAYKINKFTQMILKLLIKIKYAALPNILLEKLCVVECLQQACQPSILSLQIKKLLDNREFKEKQVNDLAKIKSLLQHDNDMPSQRAAKVILEYNHDNYDRRIP